jgi:hypothetical protein
LNHARSFSGIAKLADFRTNILLAGKIVTVDMLIAIVVDPIAALGQGVFFLRTNFGGVAVLLAGKIVAVNKLIAIVIDPIPALVETGSIGARHFAARKPGTIEILAVDMAIAIVILAIVTYFLGR